MESPLKRGAVGGLRTRQDRTIYVSHPSDPVASGGRRGNPGDGGSYIDRAGLRRRRVDCGLDRRLCSGGLGPLYDPLRGPDLLHDDGPPPVPADEAVERKRSGGPAASGPPPPPVGLQGTSVGAEVAVAPPS